MRVGFPDRSHFMENNANAAMRHLKGGLAAGQPTTNNVDNRLAGIVVWHGHPLVGNMRAR
jgi:hypothetical protein